MILTNTTHFFRGVQQILLSTKTSQKYINDSLLKMLEVCNDGYENYWFFLEVNSITIYARDRFGCSSDTATFNALDDEIVVMLFDNIKRNGL